MEQKQRNLSSVFSPSLLVLSFLILTQVLKDVPDHNPSLSSDNLTFSLL